MLEMDNRILHNRILYNKILDNRILDNRLWQNGYSGISARSVWQTSLIHFELEKK
jgi:hypothetical protein